MLVVYTRLYQNLVLAKRPLELFPRLRSLTTLTINSKLICMIYVYFYTVCGFKKQIIFMREYNFEGNLQACR